MESKQSYGAEPSRAEPEKEAGGAEGQAVGVWQRINDLNSTLSYR